MLEREKVNLCNIIKRVYTTKVLSFNNTLEDLKEYNSAYDSITVLLREFDATDAEMKRYLGEDFCIWYLYGYDDVVSSFLD